MKTKKVGSRQLMITSEEKAKMIEKAKNHVDSKIKAIYKDLNSKLVEIGLEPLNNPYDTKTGGIINV